MDNTIKHDIALLDFIRGWAALVVFFAHAALLGFGPSVLAAVLAHEAVNAFMLASGFLIYFQCSISKSYEGLQTRSGITNFAIRRYFRIAPAYYLCLLLAFLFSDFLGQCRESIAEVLPHASTDMARYYFAKPLENFLVHITFVFGLIPSYAFTTPLPDWSLGLEMQFYFMFPFLYFFYKKNFALFLTLSLLLMSFIAYALTSAGIEYAMPTLLALKFHNFAAGMVIAHVLINKQARLSNAIAVLVTLLFLVVLNDNVLIALMFVFCLWWICYADHFAKFGFYKALAYLFNARLNKLLAEMSYSVYIFHLLLMLPFFAFVLKHGPLSASTWLLLSSLLFCIVLVFAYFIYRYVEIPGINLGKALIGRRKALGPKGLSV
ncbi:acyltransferase family protein [Agaribacterium haliotis]|uniref:acyltransferase family protein n=1 Tax=Agaribacterium haliotis TaxID=2013869 RepID=UPI000BB5659B|nr:acyltransferase [Agaribacterium haliotis]